MEFSRFLLHGENEIRWYTLLEAVARSWRHLAQFRITYFTKIIFLLLHWMSYMVYTSPGRGQSKVSRAQDLQGKRRKTHSSHTIISISTLNMCNCSCIMSGLFSNTWSRQMATVKKTGQRKTSSKLLTSTGYWTQIIMFRLSLWLPLGNPNLSPESPSPWIIV